MLQLSNLSYEMDGFRTPSSIKRRKSIKNTLRRITKPRLTLEDIFTSPEVAQCHTFPSHNRKRKDDRNLEQRLEMELKMRDGTAKLMAASLNPTMSLQAAKSMIASNERIVAYVHHLRSKITNSNQNESSGDGDRGNGSVEGEAKVCVSDIRIPLIWKDSAHFKNRGDYRRFAVFCLLRIGCEIYDTSLATDVDPTVTDITFEDSIVFEKASPTFEMRLEVYCNLSSSDFRASSKRLQLGDSIGKAVGRKLAASLKDDLDAGNTGPKYEMIAGATLRLDDVNDGIKPHDLVLEATDRPFHHVPLFGHFCCRLAAQPDFLADELCFDPATVTSKDQCDVSSESLWICLKGTTVTLWKDEERSELQLTLYLNQHTALDLIDDKTMTLVNLTGLQREPYTLRFSFPETANRWVENLRRQIFQSATWKNAAEIMDFPSPAPSRVLPFGRRNFSLYEETRLKDSPVLPSGDVSANVAVANCGIGARETSV